MRIKMTIILTYFVFGLLMEPVSANSVVSTSEVSFRPADHIPVTKVIDKQQLFENVPEHSENSFSQHKQRKEVVNVTPQLPHASVVGYQVVKGLIVIIAAQLVVLMFLINKRKRKENE